MKKHRYIVGNDRHYLYICVCYICVMPQTSYAKCKDIWKTLVDEGVEEISMVNLEILIHRVCGSTPSVIQKYKKLLGTFGFIRPSGTGYFKVTPKEVEESKSL